MVDYFAVILFYVWVIKQCLCDNFFLFIQRFCIQVTVFFRFDEGWVTFDVTINDEGGHFTIEVLVNLIFDHAKHVESTQNRISKINIILEA